VMICLLIGSLVRHGVASFAALREIGKFVPGFQAKCRACIERIGFAKGRH
jgi:hypothetical protein